MAQLGARLDGIEEVVDLNPIGSTILKTPLTVTRYFTYLSLKKEIACIQ